MAQINAYRMDGIGNNFIIIDNRFNDFTIEKEKIINLAQNDKIFFDQLIFLEKEENEVYPIRIFNPDGVEVGACGNGSRCVAYLIFNETKKKIIDIKADKRILRAEIIGDKLVKINMGYAKFNDWKEIPLKNNELDPKSISIDFLNKEIGNGICINVGNPHIVFFVKDCENIDIKNIGPKIENHHYFPERVNVSFAQVVNDKNIKLNVWERGAGQTKACGTAACAATVAANIKSFSKNECIIHFKDGSLKIDYNKNVGKVFMSGQVSKIEKISFNY